MEDPGGALCLTIVCILVALSSGGAMYLISQVPKMRARQQVDEEERREAERDRRRKLRGE